MHTPVGILSPGQIDPAFPGHGPVPASAIISSYYRGVCLMDWEAKGPEQLTLKEGESCRVFKKYCHWSARPTMVARADRQELHHQDGHGGEGLGALLVCWQAGSFYFRRPRFPACLCVDANSGSRSDAFDWIDGRRWGT
jgi:hypothetical protein